jgi:hypothetical protein
VFATARGDYIICVAFYFGILFICLSVFLFAVPRRTAFDRKSGLNWLSYLIKRIALNISEGIFTFLIEQFSIWKLFLAENCLRTLNE